MFAIFGLALTYIGYFKFREADKRVQRAIDKKLEDFDLTLEDRLVVIQEAMMKLEASYKAMQEKDIDLAISLIRQAEEIHPRLFNLYNTLGYAYIEKGDYTQAIDAFKRAIEIRPNRLESYNDLSRAYAIDKRYDLSLKNLEKALSINADKVIPSLSKDTAYDNLRNDSEYSKRYQKLISKYE